MVTVAATILCLLKNKGRFQSIMNSQKELQLKFVYGRMKTGGNSRAKSQENITLISKGGLPR